MSHRPVVKRQTGKSSQVTVPLAPVATTDAASKDYVDRAGSMHCCVSRTGAYTVAAGPGYDVAIPWDTEDSDPFAMYDSGSSTRITITEAGVYMVSARITFGSTSGAIMGVRIDKNGSFESVFFVDGLTVETAAAVTKCVGPLSVGDYLEVLPYNGQGTAEGLTAGSARNNFAVYRI